MNKPGLPKQRLAAYFIPIVLIAGLASSCGLGIFGPKLEFDVSNAKAVFAGPETAGTKGTGDVVLLKVTEEGEIVPAVDGFGSSGFRISYMLTNPVTDDLLLLGNMVGFNMVRVAEDSSHFGLTTDDYHYYWGSDFDGDGAFYFSTSSGTIGEPSRIWRYANDTATSIAEDSGIIDLKDVMHNGAIMYGMSNGDTWIRKSTGGLLSMDISQELGGLWGVYSSASDTYYYGSKGFRFDTETLFDSNVTLTGKGGDIDAVNGTFITVDSTSIRKYVVQPDKTLIETVLLDTHTISLRTIDYYGTVFLVHRVGDAFYFFGTDESSKRNIFKLTETGIVEKLLTGADDNSFNVTAISFDDLGNFSASAQRLTDGKYGTLDGSFSAKTFAFVERAEFSAVTNVLLYSP
jgi:hypothetical protein